MFESKVQNLVQILNEFDTTYGLRYNNSGDLTKGRAFVYMTKNIINLESGAKNRSASTL